MIEKNHIFYVSNDAAFRVNKRLMGFLCFSLARHHYLAYTEILASRY